MWRLQGVEDLLPAVHVLSRPGELVLVDAGVLALADDLRDAVGLQEPEMAVLDLVVVAVEATHGRARSPVPFGVVLTAVARTAEAAGWNGRDHRDALAGPDLDDLLLVVLHRPVWLHRTTEVGASVRDDREARLAVERAVVANVRGSPGDLAGVRMLEERDHEPLALGEVLERSEVDGRIALLDVRGNDHEADRRHGDETADHRAETERRRFEELAARE